MGALTKNHSASYKNDSPNKDDMWVYNKPIIPVSGSSVKRCAKGKEAAGLSKPAVKPRAEI